jgi:riboflavin synthase
MFTGIVQEVGRVVRRHGSGLILKSQPPFAESGFDIGESIAVNGVCLTLLPGSSSEELMFEVSPETFSRSALGVLQPGDPVNLERALTLSDRLGGHIVQGHVDCVGECVSRRDEGEFQVLRFRVPLEYDKYLIDKGSIAVQGVSLTVVKPERGEFETWLVPHTLANTSLSKLSPGGPVNLEFDMLAKYVEKLLSASA